MTICQDFQHLANSNISNLIVELNYLEVVNLLNGEVEDLSKVFLFIEEAKKKRF